MWVIEIKILDESVGRWTLEAKCTDLRMLVRNDLWLTVSRRPPERIELIERAIEGFSATQRTRML